MIAPVFTLLAADPAVTAIIGTNPVRCFPAGNIPQVPIEQQTAQFPCVTWQTVGGMPENIMDDRPPIDHQRIQIDCWATDIGGGFPAAESLANAVQHSLELVGRCVSLNGHDFEPDTRRYRVSFDFSFWTDHG
jgi:hypothetical protein